MIYYTIMVIWVIKKFFYSPSLYSWHLFLISSASVRCLLVLSFIVPIFAWNVAFISLTFLMKFLVFHILLFSLFLCIVHLRVFPLLAILWNSAFNWVYISISPLLFAYLFSAICKVSSDNHFAFLHFFFFFFLRMILVTAVMYMQYILPSPYTLLRTSIHSSSGALSDQIPLIYLYLHSIVDFPTFFKVWIL